MPKSKRAKLVTLTKTKSDRKTLKTNLVQAVREAIDQYKYAYVFSYENLRTGKFKEIRSDLADDSRFFLGKNKILQLALGSSPETAYKPGLDDLAADLNGNVGLVFTDRENIDEYFNSFAEPDYARAGFVPAETITLPRGAIDTMPHNMLDTFRKLGMPVELRKGIIYLLNDHDLCVGGEPITPEQGRLLKLFGHQLAIFKINLTSMWTSKTKQFKSLVLSSGNTAVKAKSKYGLVTKTKKSTSTNLKKQGVFNDGRDEDEEDDDEDEDDEDMEDDDADMDEDE